MPQCLAAIPLPPVSTGAEGGTYPHTRATIPLSHASVTLPRRAEFTCFPAVSVNECSCGRLVLPVSLVLVHAVLAGHPCQDSCLIRMFRLVIRLSLPGDRALI